MTADQDDLTALSVRVLAALPHSARRSDGSWEPQDVSHGLQQLHASLKQQLAAQETAHSHVNSEIQSLQIAAPEEAQALQRRVQLAADGLQEVQPAVDVAELHFARVVALLEPATARLQTLDARATYLATALEIERRSQETKAQAAQATEAALDAFRVFSLFVQTVPSEYTALRREAMRRVDELSFGIKQYAVEKLQLALEAVEWPRVVSKKELSDEKEKMAEIARAFSYLLTLHVSQLQADSPDTNGHDVGTTKMVELWAVECVLEPIRMRFKFHFERAESKTNRVTKPEWWLSHVVDQTRAHTEFLAAVLTPELQKHRDHLDCVDAQILFLRGLTVTAMKKLGKDLPAILVERAVFCHTVDEVLLFEEMLDDEFGYDSYARSKPTIFPRMVDVLTEDPNTLFAWTKIDADYAKETLVHSILADKSAWALTDKVPRAAQQFIALLDFMCRRFAHFSNEGHRYVYISQVLFVLLGDFQHACAARAREMDAIKLTERLQPLTAMLAIVNAAQHVVHVLQAWDENPFFIELMRKVAESDKSRTEILKMHLQHSKAMFKNVAKVATTKIMAREEAVAVRQAIAGPGAMIGPTAAFSAAYSVGSKTMKSFFGRGDEAHSPEASQEENPHGDIVEPAKASEPAVDAEALLFSRTIFERQLHGYRALIASLIKNIENAVVESWRRALSRYRKSPLWTTEAVPETIDQDPYSELGQALTLLRQVLTDARGTFASEESFSQLWKPLVSSLDEAFFSNVSATVTRSAAPQSGSAFSLSIAATAIGAIEPQPSIIRPTEGIEEPGWSKPARAQFLVDVAAIAAIFQGACTKNPRAYLRKTFDLYRLVEMPETKSREIHQAMRGLEDDDGGEQISTILEACNILTLTPQQVLGFCEQQLGLL